MLQCLLKRVLILVDVTEVVHGTTVASNTILQKTGARTGLLTTRGFRDVLEIGRIRTPACSICVAQARATCPKAVADGSEERSEPTADHNALDEASVSQAAKISSWRALTPSRSVSSIPTRTMHTNGGRRQFFANAQSLLRHRLVRGLPEIKEYERTSTAVVNAYLLPAMRGYLSNLTARLSALGITRQSR